MTTGPSGGEAPIEPGGADPAWPALPRAWDGPSPGEADCMRVLLGGLSDAELATLDRVLTPAERAVVARPVHAADRRRALVGRAGLRLLLGRATGREPRTLAIATGAHGKPLLPGGPAFNLSHAGDVVLLAFAHEAAIGVDVEPEREAKAWREVAALLHPTEHAALASARDPAAVFLRLWTRKEAVAKASGLGLSVPLDAWAVDPGPAGVRLPPPGTAPDAAWSLFDLTPAPGHVAAVAIQDHAALRCWTFDPAA